VYIADTPFNRIMYYEQLDAPKSNPEQYVVEANSSLLVVAPGILSNDRSDEFAEAYSPQIVQNATGGDLFLSPSGGLIYEPGENYTGQDFFTYRLLDDTSQSYAVKVQLNVTNPVPVTEPDIYFTENGVSLTVEAAEGVLANDVDPNGDTMTAVLATDAEHGVLALNPDGSFSYAPDSGFGGQDSFTYTASDGTGSSEPTTVNLNVGYPLTPAPTTLVAMGDFDTPPVLPLLTWGHQTSAGQKKAPGDWYNVEIRLGTDLVIYSGWFPVNRVCAGVNCSLQTDKSMLPVGLQNGDHVFRVRSWADGVFSEWSAASGFNVNVPTPAFPMTFTVKPEEPRPTVVVDNDPNATWYEIWIGSTGDTDPFSHLAWYEKTGCEDALTCTIYLDAHPTNGTYQVYISGWGPAGFAVDGTNNRWSGPVDWSLSFPNAAAIGSMTPTNVNSGRPTFLWDASPGASWYNLYVGPPDFSETLAFEWYSAVELGCVDPNESCTAIPPLILEDGSSYVWYVLAWGPGGFSETVDAGYVEGPQFTVDAALAGTPTPIAPTTTQNGSQPTFSWEAVPDASWYRLLLEQLLAGDDAITSDVWYPAEALGCSDDGICETQIDNVYLGDGTYIWLVQAYTPAGLGDVSDAATFKVLRQ